MSQRVTISECDACGRECSRLHHLVAYGMDAAVCDDCCGYDPEAYDEDIDPVLNQGIGPSLYTRDEVRRMRDPDHAREDRDDRKQWQ